MLKLIEKLYYRKDKLKEKVEIINKKIEEKQNKCKHDYKFNSRNCYEDIWICTICNKYWTR
jgi:hypothetical protein